MRRDDEILSKSVRKEIEVMSQNQKQVSRNKRTKANRLIRRMKICLLRYRIPELNK